MTRAAIRVLLVTLSLCMAGDLSGQAPPFLPEKTVTALANELSGDVAKRNLEYIARFHRQRWLHSTIRSREQSQILSDSLPHFPRLRIRTS